MSEISNPHDKFFKEMFSRPEVVRDFLNHTLPAEVRQQLNLDTLELQKDSFVEPELEEFFSDLLYRVNIEGNAAAAVYLLFEHKSYPTRKIFRQLLRYELNIWDTQERNTPKKPISVIIPILIYQGRKPWHIPTQFRSQYTGPEPLRRFWPDLEYELVDLSEIDAAALKDALLWRVVWYTMQLAIDREEVDHLPEIIRLLFHLVPQQTALQFLETSLRYIAYVSNRVSSNELRQAVMQSLPGVGEKVMGTIVREWLQEGRQEGLQETIIETLSLRFGELPDELEEAIQKVKDLTRLRALHRQAVLVDRLENFTLA
ncbi:MAG: Rpn family recombination-promoting nuclease/putative transposase [Chloroflexi bacterium]|nr:Rpn family recombination-promoting nuclease/putative transposase [Chloroflexota bacterium]MBP8057167.1 Rpn family recombination-promoting nuclease/putative transposase [Chloroflexota bacterium]